MTRDCRTIVLAVALAIAALPAAAAQELTFPNYVFFRAATHGVVSFTGGGPKSQDIKQTVSVIFSPLPNGAFVTHSVAGPCEGTLPADYSGRNMPPSFLYRLDGDVALNLTCLLHGEKTDLKITSSVSKNANTLTLTGHATATNASLSVTADEHVDFDLSNGGCRVEKYSFRGLQAQTLPKYTRREEITATARDTLCKST